MDFFEQLLLETPKKVSLSPRKLSLGLGSNKAIFGPAKCGKTSLALYTAAEQKKGYLYLNLADFRLKGSFPSGVYDFLKSKKIDTLIVDCADEAELCDVEGIVQIAITKKRRTIEGFETLSLCGLDFEEYMGFARANGKRESFLKEDAVQHIFAEFIKDGALPFSNQLSEFEKIGYRWETINSLAKTEGELLIVVELLKKIALKYSLLQLFSIVKSKTKLSKDSFYAYAQSLSESNTVFFVEKLHQKNSPKKIFSYDFALKGSVDFQKDFVAVFENMVFLELRNLFFEIYYTDEAGLFVPELSKCFVAKPFAREDDENLLKKIAKKALELGIKEVDIVTVNSEFEIKRDGINLLAQPFWVWAVTL